MKKIKLFLIIGFLTTVIALAGVYSFYALNQENKIMNASARKGIKGEFIRLSKGITRYNLEGPETAKTIILLHGGSVIGDYVWEKNYKALVDSGFKVLKFDMYGRGYSDRINEAQTLDLFVSQINELTDSLKLSGPFEIIGVSMGGSIATAFADKYPEKTGKIILISPIAVNPGKKRWYIDNPISGNFLVSVYWYPRCVQKQMAEFFDGKKLAEYESHLKYLSEFKGVKADARSAWSNILAEDLTPAIERLQERNKKVLLIWGKQDPVVPIAASEKYKKLLPSIKFQEVERAGHISNYEKPDDVNAAIVSFLRD
jgi:pimeloyl-ACP methyl ester carboxylesterase